MLYLSSKDVMQIGLPMTTIIEAVEAVFREKGEGRVEMPPKPGIHPARDAFIHAMPAYVPALGAAGVKWVSGFPQNQQKGLPYISGLLVLNDPETGVPTMVCDCTWITAQRTAAASAVAARHLAHSKSSVMAMLGCGVQGRSHLEAISRVFDLDRVQAHDINAQALADYETFARSFDVEVVPCATPREAVIGADIIITAGPILQDPTPAIVPEWIKPGAFACPIDFDSYWTADAMRASALFVTDDEQQLRYYQQVGYFRDIPNVDGDLGDVVLGRVTRQREEDVIIAMNLGLAIEDMAVAIRIYERALALGIGTELPL